MNDILILGMLLDGPKHGYRLKQDAVLISGAPPLHNNTIYPLLKRYQKQGWITKKEAEGERGQTRVLYALTAAGLKALNEKLREFTAADAASNAEFRLRVGFFKQLEKPERERILDLRDEYLSERLAFLRHVNKAKKIGEWAAATVQFVAKEIQLERRWIAELRAQI